MTKSILKYTLILPIIYAFGLAIGCTVTTRTVSPKEQLHYDEAYDFSDKKTIVNKLVDSFLAKFPSPDSSKRPVIIVYGIANRTSEHISTSGITDDIRQGLLASGKVSFVSETQRGNIERETGYEYGGAVSPETRIQRARQVGARYMLTGTLRSIEKDQPRQVRFKKKTLKYYSLNLELTDMQTGLLEWADSVEVIREASKPFIGW